MTFFSWHGWTGGDRHLGMSFDRHLGHTWGAGLGGDRHLGINNDQHLENTDSFISEGKMFEL